MSRKPPYPREVRERAVKMVLEHRHEYDSQWVAITSIAGKFGMTAETLRGWVRRAEVDEGRRPGTTTAEAARIKEIAASWRSVGTCWVLIRRPRTLCSTPSSRLTGRCWPMSVRSR